LIGEPTPVRRQGTLAKTLTNVNIDRARAELRKRLGEIVVTATEEEIQFEAARGLEGALMRAHGQQVFVVAGPASTLVCQYCPALLSLGFSIWFSTMIGSSR
jgi:hypothetical protein